jgi:hypothetical protein
MRDRIRGFHKSNVNQSGMHFQALVGYSGPMSPRLAGATSERLCFGNMTAVPVV